MHKGGVSLAALGLFLLGLGLSCNQTTTQVPFTPKADPVSTIMETHVGRRIVPGELIVKRKPGARGTALPQGIPSNLVRTTSGGEQVIKISSGAIEALAAEDKEKKTLAAVENLQKDPTVLYAQPNYIYRIMDTTPNDPRYKEQWHYFNNGTGPGQSPGGISLPKVWDTNKGSSSIVVAVIDTGILPNHPDIVGSPNLAPGYDMISDTFISNDGDGRDPDPTDPGDAIAAGECGGGWPPSAQPNSWHGTHVAGTIGAGNTNNGVGVAGINWNVKVLPVRVLGKCGGTTSDIVDAIRWAAGLPVPGVPNNPNKARVINMSLGGDGPCSADPAEQSAINDAVAAGVTVVVAAGNSAHDASQDTPASCDNVITVAASDERGNLVTRYSNFGPKVEIMAPGGDRNRDDNGDGNPDGVLSTVNTTDGTYAYYNGTSMATPHVAGVAALLLACDSSLTPADVLARIQATALPRSSTQCPQACGAGLLNAMVAMPPACGKPGGGGGGGASVTLEPTDLSLSSNGSGTVTATVKDSTGAAIAAQTVTFSSDNTGVATISPGSLATDASGKAQATVQGVQNGDTQVRASVGTASAQAHVKVPSLSFWALLVLVALAAAVYLRQLLRERRVARG